jgi:hypothetical protein
MNRIKKTRENERWEKRQTKRSKRVAKREAKVGKHV